MRLFLVEDTCRDGLEGENNSTEQLKNGGIRGVRLSPDAVLEVLGEACIDSEGQVKEDLEDDVGYQGLQASLREFNEKQRN